MVAYLQIILCKTSCVWIERNYISTLRRRDRRGRLVSISAVFLGQKYLLFLLIAAVVLPVVGAVQQ